MYAVFLADTFENVKNCISFIDGHIGSGKYDAVLRKYIYDTCTQLILIVKDC